MSTLVVLDTMWVGRVTRAPRWYKINPVNWSGRRLHDLLGSWDFRVTNVCPMTVARPTEHGVPDSQWLATNVAIFRESEGLTRLLVCGRVAQGVFASVRSLCVPDESSCKIHLIPHPAARTWRREDLDRVRKELSE